MRVGPLSSSLSALPRCLSEEHSCAEHVLHETAAVQALVARGDAYLHLSGGFHRVLSSAQQAKDSAEASQDSTPQDNMGIRS